jgi:hypothetical protein
MKNTVIGALLGFVFFVCLAAKAPVVQDIIQMKPAQPKYQYAVKVNTWQDPNGMNIAIIKAQKKGFQVQQISGTGDSERVVILFVRY